MSQVKKRFPGECLIQKLKPKKTQPKSLLKFLQFKKNNRHTAIFKSFETCTENNTDTNSFDLLTHYPNYAEAELMLFIF